MWDLIQDCQTIYISKVTFLQYDKPSCYMYSCKKHRSECLGMKHYIHAAIMVRREKDPMRHQGTSSLAVLAAAAKHALSCQTWRTMGPCVKILSLQRCTCRPEAQRQQSHGAKRTKGDEGWRSVATVAEKSLPRIVDVEAVAAL